MIEFDRFNLENGLKVIVHEDNSTASAAINILYDVGASDENPNQTGFAHLFEHLMFGGSINIPSYDAPLQRVGGENNAFTTNDLTNYYLTLPSNNLETGFWLESDRMLSLAFTDKSLEVQRNVVIEEFRQRYLNQPYGDVWLLLRPLVYQVHPYQWPTIGKEISHIEQATMDDVKSFFFRHYNPENAILAVSGNVKTDEVKTLAEKWFAPIKTKKNYVRNLPQEPTQTEARKLEVERDVPASAIYKVFKMGKRTDTDFYVCDLITDILSRGNSARLPNELIKKKQLFSSIDCYLTGDRDPGLIVFSAKLNNGVSFEVAEKAIDEEIDKLKNEIIDERELQKVKNKAESTLVFSEMSYLNKAMNLAMFELMGNAAEINNETKKYNQVTASQIQDKANQIFQETNSSTLYYKSKKN